MAMRHQHDVDGRKQIECYPGIVVTFGSGQGEGRSARRPHRIDQNVQARGLDQPAGVADKREAYLATLDAIRRRIGIGARRPNRPTGALPAAAELPTQYFAIAPLAVPRWGRRNARRRNDRISVRNRFSWTMEADWPAKPGVGARASKAAASRNGRPFCGRLFLTFGPRGRLTPATLEKTLFSTRRPVLEAGGQRPTARCALGRKDVWT